MVDLSTLAIDPEVLKLIPKSTALELSVLPLSLKNNTVIVAMPAMFRHQLVTDVQFLLGRKVKAVPVPQEILVDAIHHFYEGTPPRRANAHPSVTFPLRSLGHPARQPQIVPETSTITLANRLIGTAIRLGATDIHLEPYGHSLRIRYRVDGILHEALQLPASEAKPLLSRLKSMVNLSLTDIQRPQEGRGRVKRADRFVDICVSTLPTDAGERLTMRILDQSRLQLDLARLGFEESDLELFRQAIHMSSGLVLATGPEGSGKLTTLYAALTALNRPDISITTIEELIEFELPGINQTRIRPSVGFTYAAALRALLCQDPDVILIGELKDQETAHLAVRAAQTGHLVLSTLPAVDAPAAIVRLIDLGIAPFSVASSVKLVLAQRLLRRLCPYCKVRVQPTPQQREDLGAMLPQVQFFGAKGCIACHHFGYRGRTGVFQLLPMDRELAEITARGGSAAELRRRAQTAAWQSLREAGMRKIERGETSLEEVFRQTPPMDP